VQLLDKAFLLETPTAYQPGILEIKSRFIGHSINRKTKTKIAKEAEENAKLKEATKANLIKGPDLTQPIQTRPNVVKCCRVWDRREPSNTEPSDLYRSTKEDLDYLNQFLGGRNTGMLTQGLY